MALSLNEIRTRAFAFAKEWESESSEDAEAKSFWDEFFAVFGLHRRRVATFETPVRKATGEAGLFNAAGLAVLSLLRHTCDAK